MNIENINLREFNRTMQKEGVMVKDYYDASKSYRVFFRRNGRSTSPQDKLRLFYSQDTEIVIGTVFIHKGDYYVVTSQDAQESNIYHSSIAVKCSTTINISYNGGWQKVPFALDSEKYDITENNIISVIDGMIIIYTGLNDAVKSIEGKFKIFGGTYKVKNYFYNDGLAYIYMSREADSPDTYSLTYIGLTELDVNNSNGYLLEYNSLMNNEPVDNPTLTYTSSDETIATVDEMGMLTLLANGTVTITATWTEGDVSCDTVIVISGEIVVEKGMVTIDGNPEIKVYGSAKTYTATFTNKEGNIVTGITAVWTITDNDFAASNLDITYPTIDKVKILTSDEELVNTTFTLNVVDAEGLYAPASMSIKLISMF